MRTPPSTSGTPSLERVRVDADADAEAHGSTAGSSSSERMRIAPARRLLEVTPRAAADVHADHAGGERRADVVVRAVAHVRDPRSRDTRQVDDPLEERGSGLPTPQLADDATASTCGREIVLDRRRRVAGGADAVARRAQPREARTARRGTSRPSSTCLPGARPRAASHTSVWSRPWAISPPSTPISVNGGTPAASATRVHMSVSSTSVSPTSKTTASTATRRPAPGRRASSPSAAARRPRRP